MWPQLEFLQGLTVSETNKRQTTTQKMTDEELTNT